MRASHESGDDKASLISFGEQKRKPHHRVSVDEMKSMKSAFFPKEKSDEKAKSDEEESKGKRNSSRQSNDSPHALSFVPSN